MGGGEYMNPSHQRCPTTQATQRRFLFGQCCIMCTCCFQDPRWEKGFDDYNDLGFKVSNLRQNQNHSFFQVGGVALMPSTILNPHVTPELPAREYRN